MLLKVCGVWGETAERDIATLAAARVDLVGLWHGVPGGEADLPLEEFVRLAAVARDHGLQPVIVTFAREVAAIADLVRHSGVDWVQLHAYQLPSVVRELRAAVRGRQLTIVKVLHVRGERCVDLDLSAAYERAGVDAFLLDVATEDGRVGSTGESIPEEVASSVAAEISTPFFLAGGISSVNRWSYEDIAQDLGFVGIDVSTAARDEDGRLSLERIEAIDRAWRGRSTEELWLSSSMPS